MVEVKVVEEIMYKPNPKAIIERGLKVGMTKTSMARLLEVDISTIWYYSSREGTRKSGGLKVDFFKLEAHIAQLEMGGNEEVVAVKQDVRTGEIHMVSRVGEASHIEAVKGQLLEKIDAMTKQQEAAQAEVNRLKSELDELTAAARALTKLQIAGVLA